jgi:hypothetical protein
MIWSQSTTNQNLWCSIPRSATSATHCQLPPIRRIISPYASRLHGGGTAMHPSAKMTIGLLLIGLGLTTSDSSESSKPMQGAAQQRATAPDGTDGQEASTTLPPGSPNPDASGRYHVGNGVTAPRLVYSVDPEFTDKARRKKLSGTCVVSMLVDVTGTPQDVQVWKSIASTVDPKLRSAAMALMRTQSRQQNNIDLSPGHTRGNPCPSRSRSK